MGLAIASGLLIGGGTAPARRTLAQAPALRGAGPSSGGRRPFEGDSAANKEQGAGEAGASDGGDRRDASIDPLGPNAACYVCHMTFVREAISKVHLSERIGCVKCHGLSAEHANDEHIGATPPDIAWNRGEVDRACGHCHRSHDAPAKSVVARFLERKLPLDAPPVCTDCHGRHRIQSTAGTP